MSLFELWQKMFGSNICPGTGENVVNGFIESVNWSREDETEEPVWTGQCPECGRKRPCTGSGYVLEHAR